MKVLHQGGSTGWQPDHAEQPGPARLRPGYHKVPDERPRAASAGTVGSLLLIESSPATRRQLERALLAAGFNVTCLAALDAALSLSAKPAFTHAVLELRFGRGNDLELVCQLRRRHPSMRIVIITDHDSFATVILAMRAGADDYLPKPVDEAGLMEALLGRAGSLPQVPLTPLRIQRVRWEHIQRVLEQCDRNMSEAARRLRMHRRTLQRILGKRAPLPRGPLGA